MSLIDEIRKYWGWTGIEPTEVIDENDFGNLIIKDENGCYWRLCPEDCYCKVIATHRSALDALLSDPAFLEDWHMTALVASASSRCGPLTDGRKYCLKIPGVLDGIYGDDNLDTATHIELVRFSGDVAHQIEALPDGAQIRLRVMD